MSREDQACGPWVATPLDGAMRDVIFGRGHWVVVGEAGLVRTSRDGIQWTDQPPLAVSLGAISTTGSAYVAGSTTGEVFASSDAVLWDLLADLPVDIRGFSWNGSLLVAVGSSLDPPFGGEVWTSNDTENWQLAATVEEPLDDITWGQGRFIGVGAQGRVVHSEDGNEWKATFAPPNDDLTGVASDGEVLVVVSESGWIYSTENLGLWTLQGKLGGIQDVMWAGNEFIAAGEHGRVYSSWKGRGWAFRSQSDFEIHAVAWNGVQALAVGDVEVWPNGCGCPFDQDLILFNWQHVSTRQLFEACSSIVSGPHFRVDAPGGDVAFRAGQSIVLENGFRVESGARFSAVLDESLLEIVMAQRRPF